MDQDSLVSKEIEAGARLIRHLRAKFGKNLKTAFWLKEMDGGRRYLHVVVAGVDKDAAPTHPTIWDVYGEVIDYCKGNTSEIDPFRVKALPPRNPMARDAIKRMKERWRPGPYRGGAESFGGVGIDDVYIYSPEEIEAAATVS